MNAVVPFHARWQPTRHCLRWMHEARREFPLDNWLFRGPHGSEEFNLILLEGDSWNFTADRTVQVMYTAGTNERVRFEICAPDGTPLFFVQTTVVRGESITCTLPIGQPFASATDAIQHQQTN